MWLVFSKSEHFPSAQVVIGRDSNNLRREKARSAHNAEGLVVVVLPECCRCTWDVVWFHDSPPVGQQLLLQSISVPLCSDEKITASISRNLPLWFPVTTMQKQIQQYREGRHEAGSERSLPQRWWAPVPRGADTAMRGLQQHQDACPRTVCTGAERYSPWHAQGKVCPQQPSPVGDDRGMTCMFCPSTWTWAFPKAQHWCIFQEKEKPKGIFQPNCYFCCWNKNALMSGKCLALRMGRVFLAPPLQMQMQPLQFWCFNWLWTSSCS